MSHPPFIMAGTLLFWGAHTGMLPVALIMALPLELSRGIKRRWDFDDADFNRVSDICAVIIIGLFVYFLGVDALKALYTVGKWLPLATFPLILAQTYSTRGRIRMSSLIWMLRRAEARGELNPRYLDLTYPYIAVCVIAAGAANVRTIWFYIGIILLTGWILYPRRSKRYPVAVWVIALAVISVTGFGLHTGMNTVQRLTTGWYYKYFIQQSDPLFATTAIGDIGELKPSGRIAFRIRRAGPAPLPNLLIEGVYNLYSPKGWTAMGAELKTIQPEKDNKTWPLVNGTAPKPAVTVAAPLRRGEGVLKLPADTIEVADLPVDITRRNRLGAVTVEGGPGMVMYTARTGILENANPPDRYDLSVTPQEKKAVKSVAHSLALAGRPPKEIVDRINNWFQKAFTYSLKQQGNGKDTAISHFLLHSRSGHCEFFATATVLLLREAGIPSRYVTGYGVPKENHEGWVPVRNRHAHSWAQAFIDGQWIAVDTTPPDWQIADNKNAAFWEPLYNRLSDMYFAYLRWRWGEDRNLSNYLLWLLIPMILYLARNLFRRRKTRSKEETHIQRPAEITWPGMDSAFYSVEQALLSRGYDRFKGETLFAWLSRISVYFPEPALKDRIMAVLALHYKYRFDPLGMDTDERKRLEREAGEILSGIESQASGAP